MSERTRVYRADYRPAPFTIDTVDMRVELDPHATEIRTVITVRRRPDADTEAPLELIGEQLQLLAVQVDGEVPADDAVDSGPDHLTLRGLGAKATITTTVRVDPQSNLELSGLYRSNGVYCTQCEAEGFRRITYFLDRPDVMATYRCSVVADRDSCPVLLANGNRVDAGELEGGRHYVTWEDPFPKPSYLFALVAGDLGVRTGHFRTMNGRDVTLEIYTEHRFLDQTEHALVSLQKSMQWDEEVFGLEYDLDIYMVVAVSDFNMGAMENKGLNVFNTKYVLAKPETATDADFDGVESVIAHEYFHNWTGNRVTCRDWFQLTLKEGLTVFRDQQFTADQTSPGVKRISEVRGLRNAQFPEDAGPMAHPIRPESYIAMDNFYTATVYMKGAEVIRMYHTLLGADGFRKGMDLYFQRHDGEAVTCDDFRAAMADANDVDLGQFERWYEQKGTPTLSVRKHWDAATSSCTLALEQKPAHEDQQPFHMPVRVGLLSSDGKVVISKLDGEAKGEHVISLREATAEVVLEAIDCDAPPLPSVLRDFSAPVHLDFPRSDGELAVAFANDPDPFNRWDAGQELGRRVLSGAVGEVAAERTPTVPDTLITAIGAILADIDLDGSMAALAITLPSEREIGQLLQPMDPEHIYRARRMVRTQISRALSELLMNTYQKNVITEPYRYEQADVRARARRNAALDLLCCGGNDDALRLAERQFADATNMTDSQAALACLVNYGGERGEQALASFYERWQDEPLVVDKWFGLQAASATHGSVERVHQLAEHPAFTRTNPNRLRSLVGMFAMGNQRRFHTADGSGYRFVADEVLAVQKQNPQIASRLVSAFNHWKRLEPKRSQLMRAELERIQSADLSDDVAEIVGQALK